MVYKSMIVLKTIYLFIYVNYFKKAENTPIMNPFRYMLFYRTTRIFCFKNNFTTLFIQCNIFDRA